jgi:hypothetical protein
MSPLDKKQPLHYLTKKRSGKLRLLGKDNSKKKQVEPSAPNEETLI